jgi:hypothetical protein
MTRSGFVQSLRTLHRDALALFVVWAEDIKLRRERDWAAEYRKAFEAGRESVLYELGLSDTQEVAP